MADNPKDFRDPKVTRTHAADTSPARSDGMPKWLPIVIGAIILLLLLAWLTGLFGDDDVDPAATDESTIEQTN